jgi:hypothetical protein
MRGPFYFYSSFPEKFCPSHTRRDAWFGNRNGHQAAIVYGIDILIPALLARQRQPGKTSGAQQNRCRV